MVVSGSITTEVISAVTTGDVAAAATTWESYATTPLSSWFEPTEIAAMTVSSVVIGVPLIHKASDVKNAATEPLLSLALLPLATVLCSMLGGARLLLR